MRMFIIFRNAAKKKCLVATFFFSGFFSEFQKKFIIPPPPLLVAGPLDNDIFVASLYCLYGVFSRLANLQKDKILSSSNIFHARHWLRITQPSKYRCTQLQYIFTVIYEAPSRNTVWSNNQSDHTNRIWWNLIVLSLSDFDSKFPIARVTPSCILHRCPTLSHGSLMRWFIICNITMSSIGLI